MADIDTFVITIDRTSARFETFQRLNGHLPFKVFDGIRGSSVSIADRLNKNYVTMDALASGGVTDGRLGCALSHHSIWEYSLKNDRPVLILEDDVVTHRGLPDFIGKLNLDDLDILSLGINTNSILHTVSPEGLDQVSVFGNEHPSHDDIQALLGKTSISDVRLHRCLRRFGNCCYLVTPSGAARIVERFFPLTMEGVPIPMVSKKMPGIGADRRLNALFDELRSFVTLPFLAYVPNVDSAINGPA